MAKEKTIQVKEKAVKIHQKHLKQMQGVVNTINAIQFNIGKMEVSKQTALDEMKKQQVKINKIKKIII